MPANVKIIITFTTEADEDSREKSKFVKGFSKGVTEDYNLLHLGELGAELSENVLKYWMDNINRQLTNYQVFLITTSLRGTCQKCAIFFSSGEWL